MTERRFDLEFRAIVQTVEARKQRGAADDRAQRLQIGEFVIGNTRAGNLPLARYLVEAFDVDADAIDAGRVCPPCESGVVGDQRETEVVVEPTHRSLPITEYPAALGRAPSDANCPVS